MRPGTLRKAGPEPGSLVRVALNRLDGPDSLGRPARGKQCRAKLGAHIDRDGAHEVHVCHAVSIEEGDAGFRSVIVADAEYGPAGLGDAHIGFRDLRGRDGWPGRLPSAGRIGLQPDGYQQRQNGFAQAGYPQGAPAQTKRQIFPSGSTGCSSAGGASFEAAGSLAEVSQGTAAPEAAAVGAQAGMSRQPPCCRGWLLDLPDLW